MERSGAGRTGAVVIGGVCVQETPDGGRHLGFSSALACLNFLNRDQDESARASDSDSYVSLRV